MLEILSCIHSVIKDFLESIKKLDSHIPVIYTLLTVKESGYPNTCARIVMYDRFALCHVPACSEPRSGGWGRGGGGHIDGLSGLSYDKYLM